MRIILTGEPAFARRSLECVLRHRDSPQPTLCFGGPGSDADFLMVRTKTGWTIAAHRRIP